MEEWRDIPGYETRYQVSSFGRVRSLSRIVSFGRQKRNVNGKILNLFKLKKGYVVVSLSRRQWYVHKLVAMAFLGHIPNGFNDTVDHIDFDKNNNRVENLRIISHSENSGRTRR